MFSRIVPSNSTDSCGTTDTDRRTVRRSRSCMSAPSSRMRPDVGRTKPSTRLSIVDLPEPDDPTKATVSPGGMSSDDVVHGVPVRAVVAVRDVLAARGGRPRASTARLPSFCSRSGSCSTSAIERTDSSPRAPTGMSISSGVSPDVSSVKYVDSSTTSPGVMGRMPVSEKIAASTRHPTPQELHRDPRDRRDVAVEHVEVRGPRGARRRRRPARARPRCCSRPCARVTGMSEAISPTRAAKPSTSRRNTSLRARERRLSAAAQPERDRAPRARRRAGTAAPRSPSSTIAPISTMIDDSSGWVTCCSMSSTFSTSRTTLVCTIEELTRVW